VGTTRVCRRELIRGMPVTGFIHSFPERSYHYMIPSSRSNGESGWPCCRDHSILLCLSDMTPSENTENARPNQSPTARCSQSELWVVANTCLTASPYNIEEGQFFRPTFRHGTLFANNSAIGSISATFNYLNAMRTIMMAICAITIGSMLARVPRNG
jgi:hypothetical protein